MGTELELNHFHTLREANSARQIEWTGGKVSELTWSGSELAGEVGEAAEILMDDTHLVDIDLWLGHLGEEIADSLICVDLTAINAGLGAIVTIHCDYTNPIHMSARLGVAAGRVCNTLKKLERERRGWPGSRASTGLLDNELVELASLLTAVARHFQIDPRRAITEKFNKTSERVGLKARLSFA